MTNEQNIESKVNSEESQSKGKNSLAPLLVGSVIAGISGVFLGHMVKLPDDIDTLNYVGVLVTIGLAVGTLGLAIGRIYDDGEAYDVYRIANNHQNNNNCPHTCYCEEKKIM